MGEIKRKGGHMDGSIEKGGVIMELNKKFG